MQAERSPTTLRELAGLGTEPPPLEDSILVVIDSQMTYLAGGDLPVDGIAAALDRIAELLDRARSLGTQIIHVAHRGAAGSPFDPLGGGRFIADTEPTPGEHVVDKTLPNAFAGTDLLELITAGEARPIVLCGFMTHMCVSSTARAALDLGVASTVVSDATASRDLRAADGISVVPAAAVHTASLAALADRFSVVATTRELVDHR